MELRPDLDAIEALNPEREALWTRIDKATFLTQDEKRAAVGYGPLDEGRNDLSRKDRPDQARLPAGQPGGGQWTTDDTASENAQDRNVVLAAGGRKPGGVPKALYDWTVRQFISTYCKGSIREVLPGQFEDVTIKELFDLAQSGDRAAQTCKKLLERSKYRK